MSEEPVRLKYHQATFDMLGETAVVSAAALDKITAWERRHRARLPGSLREWYTLEIAERKWTYEPFDHYEWEPVPLEQVLQSLTGLRRGRRRDRGLPVTLREGEPNCYAELGDAEDPPVVSAYDGRSQGTLSEFLFHRWWEGLPEVRPAVKWYSLAATEPAFSGMELDFLTDPFQGGPREVLFGGKCEMVNPFSGAVMKTYPIRYYFFHPGERVCVGCQADPAEGEAEAYWQIDAPTKQGLVQTAQRVWPCGTLSQTLWSETRQGRAVLKELRSSP